jgi:hypothetical protein
MVDQPPVLDPLRLLDQPELRTASAGPWSFLPSGISSTNGGTVSPGVYNELGLVAGATNNLVLQSGIYIIRTRFFQASPDKTITVAPNSDGSAGGVMIYLTCGGWNGTRNSGCIPGEHGAFVKLESNGDVILAAMTSAPPGQPAGTNYYRGMLFFMDRNNTWDPSAAADRGKIQLSSGGKMDLKGTIYGPNGYLSYTSNTFTPPLRSAVVMNTVHLESSTPMTIIYDPADNSPGMSRAHNRGLIR